MRVFFFKLGVVRFGSWYSGGSFIWFVKNFGGIVVVRCLRGVEGDLELWRRLWL